jgi:hypothetical protein
MESVARMHIVIIQQIFAVNVMMVITFFHASEMRSIDFSHKISPEK